MNQEAWRAWAREVLSSRAREREKAKLQGIIAQMDDNELTYYITRLIVHGKTDIALYPGTSEIGFFAS